MSSPPQMSPPDRAPVIHMETVQDIEVTCLVTAVPIEGESLELEMATSLGHLSENLSYLLRHVCTRLRNIQMTILEDMDVQARLSPQQYELLMKIVATQFPYGPVYTAMHYNATSTRILLRKMTNNKEQIALRAAGHFDGMTVYRIVQEFLGLTTERMLTTNRDDQAAYVLLKEASPEDQLILQMILDTLYGRLPVESAANRLAAYAEQRDDAHVNGV